MNERTKIQPVIVEVSLRNAIARRLREHGVPEFDSIADEVTLDLTGKHVVNPPAGVPHTFYINGVRLSWPQGLDTRVPTLEECEQLNRALTGVSNDRMSTEDNVRVLRACYTALWHRARIQANERAEHMRQQGECPHPVVIGTPQGAKCDACEAIVSTPAPLRVNSPVVTTAMLEGRNTVLQDSNPAAAAVVEKERKKRTRKKVEPAVSTENTLASLQDDLANLRKTLEGAG